MKVVSKIIFFLVVVWGVAAEAGVITPRLQAEIQTLNMNDTVSVIVRLRNAANFAALRVKYKNLSRGQFRARVLQDLQAGANNNRQLTLAGLSQFSGLNIKPLWIINGFAADVPVSLVSGLAARPLVDTVDLDAVVTLATPIPATFAPPEWNINMVKANTLWSIGYTGQGVVVANMDTGVDINHLDLKNRWRGGTNSWFDPFGQHATPADVNGHGTGTMSVMIGGDAGGSSIGMAPGAQWIAVKLFNDAGTSTLSAINSSFQWLTNPDGNLATDDAPDVVNASWGQTGTENVCDTTFQAAIQVLKNLDIAVVFSAGNSGPTSPSGLSPATNLVSYAVGAVDQTATIASFSSRGPTLCGSKVFPDVVAPGVNIKFAQLTGGGAFPATYVYGSGTSFAAPHVAGAMALLRGALPSITVAEMESAIDTTALDILNPGTDNDSGYGLMNIADAFFTLPVDSDSDGTFDGSDTCILTANADQRDTDADGYGNACDADLNNDGIVNFGDYGIFRLALGTANPDADFNGDGIVNLGDYGTFRLLLGKPPGPSGLVR